MTCQRVRKAVHAAWILGLEEVLYARQDMHSQPLTIPSWRKSLPPLVSLTSMRSMSYLPHFARAKAQFGSLPSVSDSAIGEAIRRATSEDSSLLRTLLQIPGQAFIVALPPPRESLGKAFVVESEGRVSKSLPIYIQVSDGKGRGSTGKKRYVEVSIFGNTRSLQGKRLCVTCVPASPHLWSAHQQHTDDATRLPFKFPFRCTLDGPERVDIARLLIVFVSIFRPTGATET
eukprot:TRINITY_DN73561_c0_g1_i1.p1 TRINITY_DN73561_c0_g1~~TRINITY_DN73561_c0_g1_i1.p1  ORF type:complete len:256 (-),score=16.85 TRINITY_DN73561_c0_g1_i1:176-868(-)